MLNSNFNICDPPKDQRQFQNVLIGQISRSDQRFPAGNRLHPDREFRRSNRQQDVLTQNVLFPGKKNFLF